MHKKSKAPALPPVIRRHHRLKSKVNFLTSASTRSNSDRIDRGAAKGPFTRSGSNDQSFFLAFFDRGFFFGADSCGSTISMIEIKAPSPLL